LYEVAPDVEGQLLQVPGISAALQNRPDGRAEFSFVLIAHWQSLSHYEAAISVANQGRSISFPAHPAYYHLATEYLGANGNASPTAAGFTFINLFEIPVGKEPEFQDQWQTTVERLIAAPGFLSARLYEVDAEIERRLLQVPGISAVLQGRFEGKAKFPFIWVSQWATLAQYEAAVRTFGRGKPFSFPSHPAFFQSATT
jgi:hypothetical protein